ncbi:MAG: hypothetical protein J6Y99_11835 [Bacteroidales bacterium]|nr:hypothetical protein [Bacteroidales bacterium]
MKTVVFSIILLMSVMTCWAQDIITFRNGQTVKAQVLELSDLEVKYREVDDPDGTIIVKNVSDLFSINYQDGKTSTFQMVQSVSSIDSDFERKLRRYKVWSKICKIYGFVNIGVGALCLLSADGADSVGDYKYEDDFDYESFYRVLGIGCCVEGVAALAVGYSLQGKRNRLLREQNLVGSAPILGKEFKVGDCTLTPSVNLMSYRNNPVQGVGAGLTVSF